MMNLDMKYLESVKKTDRDCFTSIMLRSRGRNLIMEFNTEQEAKEFFDNNVAYNRIPTSWLDIKRVVYNDPATIVFWKDGSKTIVKCGENEVFDPEKGLVMAITKKAFGNQGNYYNRIKKWLPRNSLNTEVEHVDQSETVIGNSQL